MKKIFALMLAIIAITMLCVPVAFADETEQTVPTLYVTVGEETKQIPTEKGSPFVDANNIVYIPMRAVFESYSYTVTYDQETKGIVVQGTPVGTLRYYANSVSVQVAQGFETMSGPVIVDDGISYIPLDSLSMLKHSVFAGWYETLDSVTIYPAQQI